MRAAAYLSVAVVVIGLWLFAAATFALSTTWTALGILAIAVAAALGVMAGERRGRPSTTRQAD